MLNETHDIGYDAEAFLGVIAMLVSEHPDASLASIWPLIDWEAIRWHDEGVLAFQERMDRLRDERLVTTDE